MSPSSHACPAKESRNSPNALYLRSVRPRYSIQRHRIVQPREMSDHSDAPIRGITVIMSLTGFMTPEYWLVALSNTLHLFATVVWIGWSALLPVIVAPRVLEALQGEGG